MSNYDEVKFLRRMLQDRQDNTLEVYDEIARLCGCPQWDYTGQLVRNVQMLRDEVIAHRVTDAVDRMQLVLWQVQDETGWSTNVDFVFGIDVGAWYSFNNLWHYLTEDELTVCGMKHNYWDSGPKKVLEPTKHKGHVCLSCLAWTMENRK